MGKPKASSPSWLASPPGYPLQREAPNAGGTMERGAATAVPWRPRDVAAVAAGVNTGMAGAGDGGW